MSHLENEEFRRGISPEITQETTITLDTAIEQAANVISGFAATTRLQTLSYISYTDPTKQKMVLGLPERSEAENSAEMKDCTTWIEFLAGLELQGRTRKEFVETLAKSAYLEGLGVETIGQLREIAQNPEARQAFLKTPFIGVRASRPKRERLMTLFGQPSNAEKK